MYLFQMSNMLETTSEVKVLQNSETTVFLESPEVAFLATTNIQKMLLEILN